MSFPELDKYLDNVLDQVKYIFDHNEIKEELKNHIMDKVDYYVEEGYDLIEAENIALNEMGDAKEIGKELNKQHNPIIGYIFSVSKVVIVLLLIVNIFFMFQLIQLAFFTSYSEKIDKRNIAYQVDINKEVVVDDLVIKFDELIYDKDNKLNLYFSQYTKASLAQANNITGFEIRDNDDNFYLNYSVSTNGGIISKSILTIEDFPADKAFLTLHYDHFNRDFTIEIPLKVGEIDE